MYISSICYVYVHIHLCSSLSLSLSLSLPIAVSFSHSVSLFFSTRMCTLHLAEPLFFKASVHASLKPRTPRSNGSSKTEVFLPEAESFANATDALALIRGVRVR